MDTLVGVMGLVMLVVEALLVWQVWRLQGVHRPGMMLESEAAGLFVKT